MSDVPTPKLSELSKGISNVVALQERRKTPYDGGRGDGGGSDMEARLKHLESDVSELRGDMKVVRSELSELKGKVSMLPGYAGIALIVGLIVAASTAVQLLGSFLPGASP
jgi:hypothetical protein